MISDHADFIDLKDNQRALIWLDGRFYGILGPGLYGYWKTPVKTNVEIVGVENVRFQHPQFDTITKDKDVAVHLNIHEIEDGGVGVLYVDGEFAEILNPGRYAFWKNIRKVRIYPYDLREKILDVTGQEIMTMRSQLNSAKLIEQNPTLMRLRELESVEKITEKANLQIFVGDGQELSKRIVKLI